MGLRSRSYRSFRLAILWRHEVFGDTRVRLQAFLPDVHASSAESVELLTTLAGGELVPVPRLWFDPPRGPRSMRDRTDGGEKQCAGEMRCQAKVYGARTSTVVLSELRWSPNGASSNLVAAGSKEPRKR